MAEQFAPLSSSEKAELERTIAAASFEQIPHSECSARTPLGLWSERVTGRHPVPNESELELLEKSVEREPRAAEMLARGYFELWQWALRDVLTDALKPEERQPERTRVLLARLARLAERAQFSLERAAATPLRHSEEAAFQLALFHARRGNFDLASARLDLLLAEVNEERAAEDHAVSRRASLLRTMVELGTFPSSPRRALSILERAEQTRAALRGTGPDPISLASDCYRAEILLGLGEIAGAVKVLQQLSESDERFGFSTRARARLNELVTPPE